MGLNSHLFFPIPLSLARETYGWAFVRGRDAQNRRLRGQWLGQTAQ
ncbi:MAG: hypothetical protein NTZ32_18315 [Planctomycetales bacterium]|nr:hypothetical protein [Planctomycetales bacterium]